MRFAMRADSYLRGLPRAVQLGVMVLTMAVMVYTSLPNVPHGSLGSDTIADTYEAKVIVNDLRDMYTKTELEQTPEEAAQWSKAESAPYPPAVLLAETALYVVGQRLGVGLYGMVLMLAIAFVVASAWYFFLTRWYLFPVLYLNFSYFSYRFVHVQDGTYLVMLVVIMAALWLARARRSACHALMAIAIDMKLSPLFYAVHVPRMSRRSALVFTALLVAGLALPYFIWDNYLYIYQYHEAVKDVAGGFASGLACSSLAGLLIWYIDSKAGFDMEDRIGWSLVPFGMFLAMKMNVPRHLLIVLLVPDKRGFRNITAAVALAVPAIVPGTHFGASLPVAATLLFGALLWHLRRIGWDTVKSDLDHPGRTLKAMLARG
jgi:hypothetical protein